MNVAVKAEAASALTLRAIASEALKKHDGNTTAAITEVIDRLLKDRHLLRELVAELVCQAARATVGEAHRSLRGNLSRAANRDDVSALASGIGASLLDFPLSGGLLLRDATREQVLEQVSFYEKQGRDMLHKARWLQLVAQGVPESQKVGDSLTDARAVELWKESQDA
jgi:hypothetical protein